MRAHPIKWYDQKYNIPRGEQIVMRCCSKENGPVDYIITVVHRLEEDFYKLYSVIFGPNAIPSNVKLVKTSKDPLILEDMIFGK